MGTREFTPITIIPIEAFRDQEPTTFREVVAYLKGVADALAEKPDPGHAPPLSLAAPPSSLPPRRGSTATRITLRFGELPFERASVWPHVVLGGSGEVTRGGSRTLDLGAFDLEGAGSSWPASDRAAVAIFGHAAPKAPAVSLAPRPSSAPTWAYGRTSEVRLRASRLSAEWYELTGTDRGAD
jgi:hypothetical protein